MGAACSCSGAAAAVQEFNPDGEPKPRQTPEQLKDDPAELRRAARDQDGELLEQLLIRMPVRQINSSPGMLAGSEGAPDEAGNTALHFSVALGDFAAVRKLLMYRASAKTRNSQGKTPFFLACVTGSRLMIQILLEADADPSLQDKSGDTPLMQVMKDGRRKLATWMIEGGGLPGPQALNCVMAVNKAGDSPLLIACRNGWLDMAHHLLDLMEKSASSPRVILEKTGMNNESVLGWILKWSCSYKLDTALMDRVLRAGATPTLPCFSDKVPPVCLAAAGGYNEAIEKLCAHGADLMTAVDSVKRTPLHYAAAQGKHDTCTFLLGKGIPAYQADKQQNTPLHLAGMRGHGQVAKLLLGHASSPKESLFAKNRDGVCPFHLALMKDGRTGGGQEAALAIVEQVKDSEDVTADGQPLLTQPVGDAKGDTPLLLAIGSHQERVVKELLSKNPEQAIVPNLQGELPLARCFSRATHSSLASDLEILKDLMAKLDGDLLNVENPSNSPLLALCKTPVTNFSEKALEAVVSRAGGSKLDWKNLRDADGMSPLGLAALSNNHFMVAHLLDKEGVGIDDRMSPMGPGDGMTPLMLAAKGASLNCLKVILNRRPKLLEKDGKGRTALAHCLDADSVDSLVAATMLLQSGIPPEDCVDEAGEGFLHRAVRYGMESFVDTWASHGGNLSIVCTNTPDAPAAVEDPPPAQEGTLDFVPTIAQGEESNEAEEDGQIEGPATGPGPVAEGLELRGKTMAEQSPNHYADTVGRWWDLWFQDTAVNVEDDDSICDEDLEDILGMDGLVDELAIKALYNCNNAASEPGPVAEALDGLLEKATSMNFQGMLNSAKNSLKMPAGESYGLLGSLARSFMQEPELEVTDPFLADRAEYPGVPKYVNDVNVSRTTDETVEALIAKVGAADRNSLVPIEEQLEGTALRIRNMFWYNKALSPLEFPLKLGQWKRVEKSTFARMKALQKGKKRRRGKNDLPERPALQFSTALLLAVRIGRASMVRKLLEYSIKEVNAKDGYGCGPLGYAMLHLARSRNDPVCISMVDDLLLVRPVISRQGQGIMNPLVTATVLGDASRITFMARECAANLDDAPIYLPDIPTYFRSMWNKQAGRFQSICVPLHLAIFHKTKFDLVKLMIDLGADPNIYGRPKDHVKQWEKYNKKQRNATRSSKVTAIIDYVRSFEIPGFSKPNPWATPLHLAARFGLTSTAVLLIDRGSILSNYPAISKKTPLMEACAYARTNFKVSNRSAGKPIWNLFREKGGIREDDFPACTARISPISAAMMLFGSGQIKIFVKFALAAIKVIVNFVMEARRRPVAHHDPAISTTHVLLWFRSDIAWKDTSSTGVVRDIIDNSTYKWIKVPEPDTEWVIKAVDGISEMRDTTLDKMQSSKTPKAYQKLRAKFMRKADAVYFSHGQEAFLGQYQPLVDEVNRKQHLKWNELKERKTSNIEEWLKSQKEKVTEIVKEKAEALREKMSAAIADVTADGAFDETKWIPAEDTEVDFDLPAMVGNLMAEIPTLSEMEAAATDMLEAQLESSLEEQGASLISSVMSVVQSGSKKSKAADASKSQQTKKGRKTRAQGSPSQEPDSLVTKMLRDKQEELKQEASAALNEAAADIMEGKLPTSLITPMTEATSIFEEFCTPDWVADLPEPGISLQEITQAAIFDLQEVEEMINTLMDLVGDALDAI